MEITQFMTIYVQHFLETEKISLGIHVKFY